MSIQKELDFIPQLIEIKISTICLPKVVVVPVLVEMTSLQLVP